MRENMKYNPGIYQLRPAQVRRMLEVMKQNENCIPGGVVFFGDSTIQMYNLDRWFPEVPVKYNCGIGGATSGELLSMVDEGVIKYRPSVVVLMMGINDLGNTVMRSPKEIARNIKCLIELILKNLPETEIVLLSTLPCQDHNRQDYPVSCLQNNRMVREIFYQIQDMIHNPHVIPVFTMESFLRQPAADENAETFTKTAREELYVDDLHLNEKGYEVLTGRIKPKLLELMRITTA